jgi:hypothetical protein
MCARPTTPKDEGTDEKREEGNGEKILKNK